VAVAGYEESSVLLPRDAEAPRHRFSGRLRLEEERRVPE